jgi:hypothetical protein
MPFLLAHDLSMMYPVTSAAMAEAAHNANTATSFFMVVFPPSVPWNYRLPALTVLHPEPPRNGPILAPSFAILCLPRPERSKPPGSPGKFSPRGLTTRNYLNYTYRRLSDPAHSVDGLS